MGFVEKIKMKELQEKIKKFCRENDMEAPLEVRVLDTMSELGEVAKEVLKMNNYGKKDLEYREELKGELGDVMYSLITIANTYDIDLEEATEMVLKKYEKRLEKGSASSENE
jgi:NTP pyrophosphatase (non-canonical NTP hydrolase)